MMTSVTLASNSAQLHGGFPEAQGEPFEAPKPSKRCLPATALADSCKKRRKQSTPVRISAPEDAEGKPQDADAEPPCKREPEEAPPQEPAPWLGEPQLPAKEWLGPGLLGFPNHVFMSLPQFPQSQPDQLPQRQPIRIFNPDAYCELCNKEFCNKYFLKTHKANKHGIYSDPPSSEGAPVPVNVPSFGVKLPIEIKNEPKPLLNPFSDLFATPFVATKPAKPPIKPPPKEIENELNGMPLTSSEEPNPPQIEENQLQTIKTEIPDQETNLYYSTPPSKMSPNQLQVQARELDLSNRLKKIGVMNPKAFCEICCKEYCNKYFLRTHKMKRHGIYIPEETRDRDVKIETSSMPWHQNTQTSPLNLIMAEQSGSGLLQNDRKASSPIDASCDLCGIKFQNTSLLHLHNVSVHSKLNNNQELSSNGSEEDQNVKQEESSNSKPTDTISEDLQKLQTMILQLNDLDVNNKINCICNVCNKEFENRYFLHAHMMTDHGLLPEDVPQETEKPLETENTTNNNTMCDLCGKDFQTVQEMKKHIGEVHSNQPQPANETKEDFNGFTTPEKSAPRSQSSSQANPERRSVMSLTPTSSYCEICNKELCNKYFMKTHMQRMHGIEIENGAQIGGVICDICNKELCSKYFLRVHKHNTHGIVEYGTSLLQPRKNEDASSHASSDDNSSKPTDLADLSHRYFTHFTEVCSICSRRFRSTKWLKAHLLSDHGQAGVDKWTELEQQLQHTLNAQKPRTPQSVERVSPTIKVPNSTPENPVGIQNVLSSIFGDDEANLKNYHCSYCPFTTPILPFLFVHERSHLQNAEADFKCPVCGQTFPQSELLQHHVFSQHPFIPLPPFFNANGDEVKEQTDGNEALSEADEDAKAKTKKSRRKTSSLKDVAKRSQLPASYALPQTEEPAAPYVMQAFSVEDTGMERRVLPSVVFLPVLQKQSAPMTVTFTLTPA